MLNEIAHIVHDSGQARALVEVTYWVDRPNSLQVTAATRHWITVGVGNHLLTGPRPVDNSWEAPALAALADLRKTLLEAGFQIADFDNQYWFVVTGKKRTDQEIIDFDPCDGSDYQIDCRTVKVVTTRKEHNCLGVMGQDSMHVMPPGTRARFDKALVEGQWGSYYVCAECIEKYIASEDM